MAGLSPVFRCSLSHQKDLQLWAQLSPTSRGKGQGLAGTHSGEPQGTVWSLGPLPVPTAPQSRLP